MADIHIAKFLETRSQTQVGEILGLTQGAVSQILRAERNIYFKPDELGGFTFYEIKKPRRKRAA